MTSDTPTFTPFRPRSRWTLDLRVPDVLRERWSRLTANPDLRKRTFRALGIGGATLALLLSGGAYWLFAPRATPDYDTAAIDSLFDYTLLSDEFNNLPVEERLKLLGQLIKRMRSMSAEDSVLLAGFAAGIAGAARRQLEENASRLAVDVWDKFAKDYDKVPLDQREQFIEQAFIDFSKMGELVAGQPRDVSDAQRINEARAQAQRDRDFVRNNPDRMPDGQSLGRAFAFMNTSVGGYANPQQRARGQLLMRDMTRHFRGQDPATGKPPTPGQSPTPAPTPAPAPPGPG